MLPVPVLFDPERVMSFYAFVIRVCVPLCVALYFLALVFDSIARVTVLGFGALNSKNRAIRAEEVILGYVAMAYLLLS